MSYLEGQIGETQAQRLQRIKARGKKIYAHVKRVRSLPKLQPGEADRLVAEYLRSHEITRLPAARTDDDTLQRLARTMPAEPAKPRAVTPERHACAGRNRRTANA